MGEGSFFNKSPANLSKSLKISALVLESKDKVPSFSRQIDEGVAFFGG